MGYFGFSSIGFLFLLLCAVLFRFELPYEGAKEMLLVDNVDDRAFFDRAFPGYG